MKHSFILVFLLLGIKPGLGQNVVRKVLLLPHITTIQIDADSLSQVSLETVSGSELSLEAVMEGEYKKDLSIELVEEGNTLRVSAAIQPFFIQPNDKLSAHKVIAISLSIGIPEDKIVYLYGTSARVSAMGIYKNLKVVLSDGQCVLKEAGDHISVTTQSGNIVLYTAGGSIRVNTKYGRVERDSIPLGENNFALQSNSGNITIRSLE
ncbi:hypothetical protein [Muriicola soli]|uniref:Adhesin domain-containing protein n=1 Tax=Muriicola soli TaxID=2507538 RepID=A0A411EBV2_9FLAO|nr:hypothetical protein [Muriicola soli]QBA65202.1 hypothetical protein EQY75_12075 [Muriicola soli]